MGVPSDAPPRGMKTRYEAAKTSQEIKESNSDDQSGADGDPRDSTARTGHKLARRV